MQGLGDARARAGLTKQSPTTNSPPGFSEAYKALSILVTLTGDRRVRGGTVLLQGSGDVSIIALQFAKLLGAGDRDNIDRGEGRGRPRWSTTPRCRIGT